MKVKFISSAIIFAVIIGFSAFSAFAQESEAVVIDEVVAQVNDSVITLSRVKREMQVAADMLVQQGKTPEAAKAEAEKKKGEIIAGLINEELIMQKGKEIGVDSDVDAQINQRFLQFMKEQNLKTVDQLYKAMNDAGVKPDEIREVWRRQITREMVIQHEVSSKYYFSRGDKEIRDYYEQHKDKFTKPETVALSEILLGFAGRDMAAVRTKADEILKQARGGADFAKLVAENSDRPDAAKTKGSVGTLEVKELSDKIAAAIKGLKAGDVTKFETDEGVEIVRVDARDAAASESVYDEEKVRNVMTFAALPEETKKYQATLRKEAYIKISEPYNALVSPLLNDNTTTATVETKKPGK